MSPPVSILLVQLCANTWPNINRMLKRERETDNTNVSCILTSIFNYFRAQSRKNIFDLRGSINEHRVDPAAADLFVRSDTPKF